MTYRLYSPKQERVRFCVRIWRLFPIRVRLKRRQKVDQMKWKRIHTLLDKSHQPPPTNLNLYIRSQHTLASEEAKAAVLSASMTSSRVNWIHKISPLWLEIPCWPIESCFLQRTFPTQQQAIDFIDYYRSYDRDIKVISVSSNVVIS